jgi:hypothetical protein
MPIIAPQLAEVAQLVADPGRANILSTLMDGRALSAGELAIVAGVTPQPPVRIWQNSSNANC